MAKKLTELVLDEKRLKIKDTGKYVNVIPIGCPRIIGFKEEEIPTDLLSMSLDRVRQLKPMDQIFNKFCSGYYTISKKDIDELERAHRNGIICLAPDDGWGFPVCIQKRFYDKSIRKSAPRYSDAFFLGDYGNAIMRRNIKVTYYNHIRPIQYYKIQRGK